MAMRVVCIEDEPDMIELIRLILHRRGMEVTGAYGGTEGLALVESEAPDLVLLDLMMPDVNGWDVYERLKANPALAHIPILIVTAKASNRERLMTVRQTGIDDFLIKPFGPVQLIESVERVLARSRNISTT